MSKNEASGSFMVPRFIRKGWGGGERGETVSFTGTWGLTAAEELL